MRRRYVISYDISDDKRRTRVFELLLGNGDHVQFSVFLADLSQRELIVLPSLPMLSGTPIYPEFSVRG
jgi:CRISPR-associated protein Cas2